MLDSDLLVRRAAWSILLSMALLLTLAVQTYHINADRRSMRQKIDALRGYAIHQILESTDYAEQDVALEALEQHGPVPRNSCMGKLIAKMIPLIGTGKKFPRGFRRQLDRCLKEKKNAR